MVAVGERQATAPYNGKKRRAGNLALRFFCAYGAVDRNCVMLDHDPASPSSGSGYLIRCIPLSFLARSAVPSGGPAVSSGAFGCPIRRPSLRSSLPLRFACGPLPFMWPWAATGPGWDSRTRLRHPACRENLRTRHPAYHGPLCACDILFFVNPFAPVASTARSKSPSLIFSAASEGDRDDLGPDFIPQHAFFLYR